MVVHSMVGLNDIFLQKLLKTRIIVTNHLNLTVYHRPMKDTMEILSLQSNTYLIKLILAVLNSLPKIYKGPDIILADFGPTQIYSNYVWVLLLII